MTKQYNVLFLCTGNSARSIMAEAILNHKGQPRFHAFSAGSHPTGRVHPEAVRTLQQAAVPTDGLRSKSWDEFSAAGAPVLDFILTVCDNAAKETCPIWPGHPMTAHWGIVDPAAATGETIKIQQAFRTAFEALERRIDTLLQLPLETVQPIAIKDELARIGEL